MKSNSLLSFRLFAGLALALVSMSGAVRAAEDDRPVVDDSKARTEQATSQQLPTLWIVGDSTVKGGGAPQRGWGEELGAFFDPKRINVVNRAIGGRSSRTFQVEGKWDAVLRELKAGDFVLLQFGHNDGGRVGDPASKDRPSLPGLGEETQEVTTAKGGPETVHTFGWYLRKYANDAKAKGATLILCSMVPHKDWEGGHIRRNERAGLVKWTAQTAETTGVPYVDLNEIIALGYERIGPERVAGFFADARTHTTVAGAQFGARAVIVGLKGLKGSPLDSFLSEQGRAISSVEAPAEQP